jgi:hypothetical protein
MRKILFQTDSAAGSGASPDQRTESKTPAPAPAAAPAADTVNDAAITEETEQLRKRLADTEAAKKKVEMDHASVTDEFKRFKDATDARQQPVPVPVRKKAPEEKSFRIGRFV